MTDEKDKPDDETPDATAEGPVGGERLAEARRAKQISVLEIAKELHVEEAKIRALETNEFDVLGAPVFAKGHLKKYSQLVGVNHDDVLADYYRLTRSQEMPPVVVQRQKPNRELTPGPWIIAILVIASLAIAYGILVERPFATLPVPPASSPAVSEGAPPAEATEAGDEAAPPTAEPAGETESAPGSAAEPPPGEVPGQPVENEQTQPAADQQTQPIADAPMQPIVVELAQPATTVPAADGDDVRLSVTFVGDCWTEIMDASGRRLFFQLGRAGRTVNVSGPGPLSVLFGDADNVDIRVNGEDFSIPAASRRGRTARLSITGS
jgi:cytoskeleton protein RodZ